MVNAGVGDVSLKGAPVALPTVAIAPFPRFYSCGRAVMRLLPLEGESVRAPGGSAWISRC